jgi:hypothetical protein
VLKAEGWYSGCTPHKTAFPFPTVHPTTAGLWLCAYVPIISIPCDFSDFFKNKIKEDNNGVCSPVSSSYWLPPLQYILAENPLKSTVAAK